MEFLDFYSCTYVYVLTQVCFSSTVSRSTFVWEEVMKLNSVEDRRSYIGPKGNRLVMFGISYDATEHDIRNVSIKHRMMAFVYL